MSLFALLEPFVECLRVCLSAEVKHATRSCATQRGRGSEATRLTLLSTLSFRSLLEETGWHPPQ